MLFRSGLLASIMISLAIPAAVHAADDKPLTKSGKAWATVRKAVRQDNTVAIELRFETDYEGYSGETIYEKLSADAMDDAIYLTAGDKRYPLHRENGKAAAPGALKLTFNYDPKKNPRVGDWKAQFDAPPAEAAEVTLTLPNVAPIGPIAVKTQ
ncbi:hypothetical protein ACUSIJ_03610 [Pseudochelatococcus sp. B33]